MNKCQADVPHDLSLRQLSRVFHGSRANHGLEGGPNLQTQAEMFCIFFKSVHYPQKDCEDNREAEEDEQVEEVKEVKEVEVNDDDPGASRACLDDELAKDSRGAVAELPGKAVAKDPEKPVARFPEKPAAKFPGSAVIKDPEKTVARFPEKAAIKVPKRAVIKDPEKTVA